MKLKQILSSAAVAATLLCAGAANAALYQFTVSGDYSASWQLDTDRVPDIIFSGVGITYADVAGAYPGAVRPLADISFFNESLGGGLTIEDYYGGTYLVVADGPQIYSGDEDTPAFATGTYALTQYQGTGTYSLTVSAVPEPATYGMLLAGMGLVGAALRRRQGR